MRIAELEICNFRGIRRAKLEPQAESFAVYGPNGTGKSAFADAIEFLLTGNLSRLSGPGTQEASIKQHAKHIDCQSGDAFVRAKIHLPTIPHAITISRALDTGSVLNFDPQWQVEVEYLESVARRNYFMLTRRQVLGFIAARPATRADQVRNLMNLGKVEDIRATFVQVDNKLKNECAAKDVRVEQCIAVVRTTLNVPGSADAELLEAVNQHCSTVGHQLLESLADFEVLSSVPPIVSTKAIGAPTESQLAGSFRSLYVDTSDEQLATLDAQMTDLRQKLNDVHSDPTLLRDVQSYNLLQAADGLIAPETTDCPVCLSTFDPGVLHQQLEHRISEAQSAKAFVNSVEDSASALRARVSRMSACLTVIASACSYPEVFGLKRDIAHFLGHVNQVVAYLSQPTAKYEPSTVVPMIGSNEIEAIALRVKKHDESLLSNAVRLQPEEESRDVLIKSHGRLSDLSEARSNLRASREASKHASVAHLAFVRSQDRELNRVYKLVRERFEEFYNLLHHPEDEKLQAELEQSGPSLAFRVSFGEFGSFPPYALHSEGHQDTMGLCLFLALSEFLQPEGLDLIILDDVISSVDADHRGRVGDLLRKHFANRQLFITTHDKIWVRQLQAKQVVVKRNVKELYGWSVAHGPRERMIRDVWDEVNEALDHNRVQQASGALRHGMEGVSAELCERLAASVRFRFEPSWEFGELFYPAKAKFAELLSSAYHAAEKRKDKDLLQRLVEAKAKLREINRLVGEDLWMVNTTLHYNSWENLSSFEFRTVVEHMRTFIDLVSCPSCGSFLRIDGDPHKPTLVTCECKMTLWLLDSN